MASQFSPAIEELIRTKMASGKYASEEELLIEALKSLEESDAECRAIEDGLASADRGDDGVPLSEAFNRLRERHNIEDPS